MSADLIERSSTVTSSLSNSHLGPVFSIGHVAALGSLTYIGASRETFLIYPIGLNTLAMQKPRRRSKLPIYTILTLKLTLPVRKWEPEKSLCLKQ